MNTIQIRMGRERMIAIRTVEQRKESAGNNHTKLAVFMKQPFLSLSLRSQDTECSKREEFVQVSLG